MKNLIFVSYSSLDQSDVAEIIKFLDDEKLSYFKAPEMIPPGSNYAREIPHAIQECSIFLLLLSRHSQESMWVEKELDCAINHHKIIIPVQLTPTPLNETFHFYLNNVQLLPYWEETKDALFLLVRRIREIVAAEKMPKIDPYYNAELEENKDGIRRFNTLQPNQIPVECERCGSGLEEIYRGTYRCVRCGNLHYDSYQTIRNYLSIAGPRTITQVAEVTGVPRKTIEYFLRDERFEIPSKSKVFLICDGCGKAIRTGCLCDSCKDKGIKPKKNDGNNRYCMASANHQGGF